MKPKRPCMPCCLYAPVAICISQQSKPVHKQCLTAAGHCACTMTSFSSAFQIFSNSTYYINAVLCLNKRPNMQRSFSNKETTKLNLFDVFTSTFSIQLHISAFPFYLNSVQCNKLSRLARHTLTHSKPIIPQMLTKLDGKILF